MIKDFTLLPPCLYDAEIVIRDEKESCFVRILACDDPFLQIFLPQDYKDQLQRIPGHYDLSFVIDYYPHTDKITLCPNLSIFDRTVQSYMVECYIYGKYVLHADDKQMIHGYIQLSNEDATAFKEVIKQFAQAEIEQLLAIKEEVISPLLDEYGL